MLLLEMAHVEFLNREVSSIEAESQMLEKLVVEYLRVLEQLEYWKSENGFLQRKKPPTSLKSRIAVPYFIIAPLVLTLFLTLPRGYDPEFLVHSAALQYPRNNTPSEFTAMWNLTLLAMNPNKKWDM
ncbi:unnamed protein product [Prunus brigantina]